jgi:hypothetical protein
MRPSVLFEEALVYSSRLEPQEVVPYLVLEPKST